MIVIRTNANGTLGHLARMRHLSRALQSLGHATRFLLDRAHPALAPGWLDEIDHEGLYDGDGGALGAPDVPGAFADEADDARRCLVAFAELAPNFVVVDDYRLGLGWERAVRAAGYPILALEDLTRAHEVDVLVEPGLAREPDPRSRAPSCTRLRGPRYALLGPEYAGAAVRRSSDEPARMPTVLLSLGGGGDLALLARLLAEWVAMAGVEPGAMPRRPFLLRPVIGPQARNAQAVRELASAFPDVIRPIVGADSLAAQLGACDLFVGAAGTSLYESAACRVPALTFAIADNQRNDLRDLERLGHYLHLDRVGEEDCRALAALTHELLGHLPRLRALRDGAEIVIDAGGAGRIAAALDRRIRERTADDRVGADAVFPAGCPRDAVDAGDAGTGDEVDAGEPFTVLPCDDRDINRYVEARNLETNRANMTTDAPIARLAHYRWWFRTRRHSYRLERRGTPELYIWHEIVATETMPALIGGWFVGPGFAGMESVMAALDWQLAHTDAERPELPWIAIIKRDNRFVRRLNERAGFREAPPGSREYRALRSVFPEAAPDAFQHVFRPPVRELERRARTR